MFKWVNIFVKNAKQVNQKFSQSFSIKIGEFQVLAIVLIVIFHTRRITISGILTVDFNVCKTTSSSNMHYLADRSVLYTKNLCKKKIHKRHNYKRGRQSKCARTGYIPWLTPAQNSRCQKQTMVRFHAHIHKYRATHLKWIAG